MSNSQPIFNLQTMENNAVELAQLNKDNSHSPNETTFTNKTNPFKSPRLDQHNKYDPESSVFNIKQIENVEKNKKG